MRIKEIFLIIAFIFAFILLNTVPLEGESGIYEKIGIIPEHGLHGAVPEENIDLFTGNMTLKFLDIHLSGQNGFDLEIWRVYNSKIVSDHVTNITMGFIQEPQSWVGLGWSLHMGRLHHSSTDTPTIEFPDGRQETAHYNSGLSAYITRNFLKLKFENGDWHLYLKNGTVWTFGHSAVISYGDTSDTVLMVTKIKNSFGHEMNVEYRTAKPVIEKITDSMGREVIFETDDTIQLYPKLDKIKVKNAEGQWTTFDYTVDPFPCSNYYKLSTFKPPEIPASTYTYYCDANNRYYELQALSTGLGGTYQYEYEDHIFYFYGYALSTRVIKTKRMKFSPSDSYKTWNYTYPSYQNTSTGTVTVDGPVFDTKATYHAYPTSNVYQNGWKIGLLIKKWFTDNSYSEEQEWTYHQVSDDEWEVLYHNLGTIKAPLLSKSIITREGDAESTEEYLYERANVKKYGFPTKIKYYGGTSGTTLKNYKTLQYFFETNGTYESNYLLSYIKNESIFNSSGQKLKETQTKYYISPASKYGAIDEIKKWRIGGTYLTWDYSYSSTYPRDITITINLPGVGGTETYKYSYGVLSELKRPGYTELTRTISQYNSAILSETNQHNGTMDFTYDDLGRITKIEMPTGFNDIYASWSPNSVDISQGGNSVVKYWDGMGRDTGFKESGDGINLFFRKILAAEGRVTAESKGSTNALHRYSYQMNAAGNPTKITDPRGKVTNIAYSGDQKTVTDAEGNSNVFYYEGLPGLATQLKDASNKYAQYTYDGSGRLTQVKYNNARTQAYAYNGLDQVTSESHPETGPITYNYNSANNLEWRNWDNKTIIYQYNASNQLTVINSGDETINYYYDIKGRVKKVSSNNGWYRDNIYYNELGSIAEERQYIPGTGYKTLNYTYDGNNNLNEITYPDNKTLYISNNSLNMPETLSLDGKSMVSQAAYGINKQPTSMTISGNNTSFSASYKNNGLLSYASLKKGGITHYQANYGYDNVGNITSIYNTVPSLNATFGYDSLYRLTSASYSGGKNYAYTYDYYGNLKTTKENGSTIFNVSYNTKNQVSSSGFDYDNRGNMTKAPGFEYEWDRQNRLKEVQLDTGETTSTHTYNERGLRIKSSRSWFQSITIISPNGGEIFQEGTTQLIQWSSTGNIENVKIEYSIDNGSSYIPIVASTPNTGFYSWTIPGTPSTTCLVKVSNTSDDCIDISDSVFSIQGISTFVVVSPNGGDILEVGSVHSIEWLSPGNVGDAKIEYSIDNGVNWMIITELTPDDGSYEWTVPNTPSSHCLVRIGNTDGELADISDAPFTIFSGMIVTSPNGGESWDIGTSHPITWDSTTSSGYIKIELSTNNGTSWTTIVEATPNDGSYNWTVPNNPSTNCLIRISKTTGDQFDISDNVFSITFPSAITVTFPNGGEVLEGGTSCNITWTSSSTVGNVKIEYSTNSGTSWSIITSSTSNDGTFAWDVPNMTAENCLVRVSETDGSPSDTSDDPFSIVTQGVKSITVISPNGGEIYEARKPFTITWISTGNIANVSLTYNKKDGMGWWAWVAPTPNDGEFTCDMPDFFISEKVVLRITDFDDITVYDSSDAPFKVVAEGTKTINITSPIGGEIWGVGTNQEITWATTGNVGNVKIEYSNDNGNSWDTIADSTANDGIYNWTVPNDPSNNCLIRISETDGNPTDVSNSPFSITTLTTPAVTVTSPNGGETLEVGTVHDITWNSVGILENVRIKYSLDSGSSWTLIVISTPNDELYKWTVPNTLSDNCLIRISDTDGIPADISDAVFSIVPAPGITVTSPNGGEVWEIDSSQNITWTSVGAVGNVKIDYSFDNGSSWVAVVTSTPNDGSYKWSVPETQSENCLIRVSELDGTPSDVSDTVFSIVPPPITITSPNGGEVWEKNASHPITWTSFGIVGDVKIDYSTDNGTTWTTIIAAAVNSGSYDWTVPDTPSEGCLIRVSETDGDPYDISDNIFSIVDELEPGITVTAPNGGEIWAIHSNREITWTSTGAVGEVKIEYSINTGSSWTTIVTSTPNDSTFNWTVPANPSENCLIRISEIDSSPIDTSDAVFSIISDTSPCGKSWSMSNYSGTDIFKSAAYGNSLFAAVGSGGVIFTGSDGITWNPQSPGITNDLNGVGYGNDTFVAVGDSGVILTSPNGTDWTPQSSGTSANLHAVTYGNSTFAAVGNSGVILTSSNGITWNPQSSHVTHNLNGVGYGNNTFAVVGDSGVILTSPNGTNWTRHTSNTSMNLWGITHAHESGSHPFVAVGNSGVILTSPDGIDWNSRISIVSTALLGAAYGSNKYVIVGQNGEILTSMDGIGWTAQSSGGGHHLYGIVYDNERFVAAGEAVILYSLCGAGSPSITVTSPNGGESIIAGTNQTITWASTGTVGDVKIDYSTDSGTSWTEITASSPNAGSYDWTVPDTPSTHCLVRVSEIDDDPSDVSDSEFCILPASTATITVTSPNGGETLLADATHEITWTFTGTIDHVFIEYSLDNGVTWKTIVLSTINSGSYQWTVPDTPSDECLVRIGNSDAADGEPSDVSDALFSIVPVNSITITSPNGGESWEVGSTQNITWTSTGTVGPVKIEYSTDRGNSWTEIIAPSANDGSYEWTIPGLPEPPLDECLVRISEHDVDEGPSDVSDEAFSIISSVSAFIKVTAPNGGECLAIGSTQTITWTGYGTNGDIKIDYSTDSGASWTEIAAATENDGQYDWNIPDTPSDTCLVLVSEMDGDPSDESDAPFSIALASTITVTSPNGGEAWEVGSSRDITWTSTGTIEKVRLEYSIDSGTFWADIAASTDNDGIYNWAIPDKPSDNCLVRISGMDGDENPSDISDAEFSISSSSTDTITITAPNGGEALVVNNTYDITWISTGSVGEVTIEYSIDSGTSWTEIITDVGNDGTYEWTVPDDPSDNCMIRISESTDSDPSDTSDSVFSIVPPSPETITITSPNGGEILEAGSTHEITWTSTGTIDDVVIEYSINSGTSWTTIITSTTNNGSYDWTIPDTPSENCIVKICMDDEDRNPFDVSDAVFSIVSSSSETVTVTSPNGGEGLIIGSTHEITWTSTGTINSIMIEYSTNNGSTWAFIIGSTENDGSHEWSVPDHPSSDCLVRISGVDGDENPSDVSDSPFSIVSETPSCGDKWLQANYSGSDTFNSVTYGGGKFVAVGNNGVIKTSSDGINWTSRTSNTTDNLYGVDHGFDEYTGVTTFVVCGENGTIMTSPDAINWTAQNSGTNNTLYSVIHEYSRFVAVGINGTIVSGPDGVTWYDYSLNISQTLYSTAFRDTMGFIFVAVGTDGVVFTSYNGVNWTRRSSVTSQTLRGVTFGDNQFVAVGDNGVILTSSDGIKWTSRTSSINVDLLDTAYGNGVYVVVGNSGKILTSGDCVYWDSPASGIRGNLSGVVFGNSRFVSVGGGEIIYSICDQAGAANILNNQKFLRGPGAVFPKRAPGRRRQGINENIDVKASLNLVSPNGDETLQAGENFLITWKSEKYIENIKLEYSPDNGSTYLLINDRIPNTGYYEWHVPYHISSNCLVRISNADGMKPEQNILLYDLKFKVNSLTPSPLHRKDFIFWLGDKNSMNPSIPKISIIQESNGKEYICFEENTKEIRRSKEFHNRWHSLKVLSDYKNDRISIFLDEKPVFKNISMSPGYLFTPAISMSTAPGDTTDVEIDDLTIHIFDYTEGKNSFITLFKEDFERFDEGRFPENSGWISKENKSKEKDQMTCSDAIFISIDPMSGLKTLKLNPIQDNNFIVVKHFNVPENFPFDTSDRTFEIRYNEDMQELISKDSVISRHDAKSLNKNLTYSTLTSTIDHENIHGPNNGTNFGGLSSASGLGRTQSTSMIDTYYIYSFDGKLIAEYDHDGNCVKDYIYAGNRLIAEYQPQTGKYYYYMNDQINSTRIITDDYGTVVYSEAYGPYGAVQKNWTKSYDPKLKFSGKEREDYSDLDYFGARYYDHNSYRFISVDPIINKGEAFSNPQLWNLYAYCRNNPITYLDPDGRSFKKSSKEEMYKVPYLRQIIDAMEQLNQLKEFWMGVTFSIAANFFMGPMDFATPRIGGVSKGGSEKGLTIGKKFFKGKTFKQIDKIFRKKGFEIKGQDPLSGKGSYINPKTGTKYYLDKGGWYRVPGKGRIYESPHVDVEIKGSTQKFRFFIG